MQVSLSLAELLMILPDMPLSRKRDVETFRNFDLEPDIRHRVKTAAIAYVLALNGFGLTVLNPLDSGVHETKTGVACLPTRDSIHPPVYGLAYPEGLHLNPMVQRFMNAAKNATEASGFEEICLPYEIIETLFVALLCKKHAFSSLPSLLKARSL